jgi:dipeptidyl aminopeptidase/acylaminoacyl peptidase
MSVVRSRAPEWQIDPQRIGILGFSAGGETAALTALFDDQRQYAPLDDMDDVPSRPDFAVLVYSAGIVDRQTRRMHDYIQVTEKTPPMFLVHAFDDGVPVENCLTLFLELKKQNVASELHVYHTGGHGYGLRATGEPVTQWPERCAAWLRASQWLEPRGRAQ